MSYFTLLVLDVLADLTLPPETSFVAKVGGVGKGKVQCASTSPGPRPPPKGASL